MSTVKERLMEVVSSLPDDCTYDDFRYRLYLHRKMEESQKAIDEGRVYTQEQAREMVKSWRKSSGPSQP